MLIAALITINFLSIITMYFLNETIASLQRQNNKLIGDVQNLNNELLYLKEQLVVPIHAESSTIHLDPYNPQILIGILGVLTIVVCGLTILMLFKNDTSVMADLSKNSIKATGDYVKEIIIPSVELLNKTSESRINANLDNVKKIVTETGSIITNHVTDVNKEGVLCIVNTIKPQVSHKVLGKISRELLNYIP